MKRMRKAAAIFAAGVISTLLTGCSDDMHVKTDSNPKALSIVVGNHMCSRELNLNSPMIMETVSDTIGNYGFISIVGVDGSPSLIAADDYDIPEQYKNAAETKLHADAQKKAHSLMMQLGEVRADDCEVDTLKALQMAVRSFDAVPETADRTIIVVDTGWSTTGLLDFSNHLLNGEPEAIAEMLDEKNAIPDMQGVTVKWQQMGDVAAPQQELSQSQVFMLEEIWRAVIEKGGGIFEHSDIPPNNGTIGGSLPEVSVIELPWEEPVKFDIKNTASFEEPVFFSEEQIRFYGDSDRYKDPEKAMDCIEPVAEYMLANTDFRLLLAGTTAGDEDSKYVRELSYARANAVKNSLVEMGVPETRIFVAGLGNSDPWHIYGVGTEGALAAQNRKVVMISADAREAVLIQQKYGGGDAR